MKNMNFFTKSCTILFLLMSFVVFSQQEIIINPGGGPEIGPPVDPIDPDIPVDQEIGSCATTVSVEDKATIAITKNAQTYTYTVTSFCDLFNGEMFNSPITRLDIKCAKPIVLDINEPLPPNNNLSIGITSSVNTVTKLVRVGHHSYKTQYTSTITLTIESNHNLPVRTFEIFVPTTNNKLIEKFNLASYFSFYIEQAGSPNYNNYYSDVDGDGFGDCEEEVVVSNVPITGKVTNGLDGCPFEYSKMNNGCLDAPEDSNRNWIKSNSYNIEGKLIAAGKNYYDDLGKIEQSQSYNAKYKRVYANQTMYDSQGRPALQTLSAPITPENEASFLFKEGFVKNNSGQTLTSADLDENGALDPIISSTSTLGLYHNNNADESLQDKTDRPYTRSVYSTLNPGAVKQTVGGNKQNGAWRRGYSFSMPATQEMYYVYGYNTFPSNPSIAKNYSNITSVLTTATKHIVWLKAGKTVVQDVKGNEAVVFTDADGKTLGAARAGGTTKYDVLSLIGTQKFVDIHIPIGCEGTASLIGNSSDYKIYNLKTELPNGNISQAGFYRIEYIGDKVLTKSHALTYIDKSVTPNVIKPVMGTAAVGIRYKVNYYDYSLNYYNTIGQLTSSLQPLGFIDACLNTLSPTVSHNDNLKSTFTYNSLGQLTHTNSPDEGDAWFKYRRDGQIRFSQNSKQKLTTEFSYTNYDELGRPVESGVAKGNFINLNADGTNSFSGVRKEQHFTQYDFITTAQSTALITGYKNPTFLSGNVARTYNYDNSGAKISETYYSYDVYGRVKWIVQNLKDLGTKTIDYEYDPITSQVNKVYFQKGVTGERFIHKYSYDTDTQQLVKVETSTNDSSFTTHAEYSYYKTNGALKRTTLAGGIQDIDYVYNLAGQLKAINHPSLQQDPAINPNGTDLFGVTLDYYNGDYQRNTTSFTSQNNIQDVDNQYFGNIKAMTWNTKTQTSASNTPVLYKYKYNDRNYLQEAIFMGMGNQQTSAPTNLPLNYKLHSTMHAKATNSITLEEGFEIKATSSLEFSAKIVAANANGEYKVGDYNVSNLTYDKNGNILSLDRNKNTENGRNEMDKLGYVYKTDKPNQLLRVTDAVTLPTDANDIKGQTGENYKYNEIGQLTDNIGEAVKYEYNASGLVTKVHYNNKLRVHFYYNDKGFRTKKLSYKNDGNLDKTTDYVLDASGSVLAIYVNNTQVEIPIYGASRLGMYNKVSGTSVYQLTDHLGNVRAVIAKNGSQAVAATSTTDYYPGGMAMPNRVSGANSYRYGYQGEFAETDEETGKPAFQLRIYDPRINRWLSPDPMGQYHSPYMAMDNRPNMSVDPTGGCTVGVDCPSEFDWMDEGTWVADDINIGGGAEVNWGSASVTGGGLVDFSQGSVSLWDNVFSNQISFNGSLGSINADIPNFADDWASSSDILANASYSLVNGFYVTGQTLNPFDRQLTDLTGAGVVRGSEAHLDSGVDALTTLMPIPLKGVNAFKGVALSVPAKVLTNTAVNGVPFKIARQISYKNLAKQLRKNGFEFVRNGKGDHKIWKNLTTNKSMTIPDHKQISIGVLSKVKKWVNGL